MQAMQQLKMMQLSSKLGKERYKWQDQRVRQEEKFQRKREHKERKARRKMLKERKKLLAEEQQEAEQDIEEEKITDFEAQEKAEAEEKKLLARLKRDGYGTRVEVDKKGRPRNLVQRKTVDGRRK